jgi:hypothetical protein
MPTKISALPAVAAVAAANEFAIVRQLDNYKVTTDEIEDRILRPGNVGTGPVAPLAVTVAELANAINGVARRFNADMVDGQHAADLFGGMVPLGGMVWWSGAIGAWPANWDLCDGANGTPNLVDRFIVGSGNTYTTGDIGGADTNDTQHTHGHTGLSINLTGAHTHDPASTVTPNAGAQNVWDWAGIHPSTNEGDHTHAFSGETASAGNAAEENRPVYWALAIIQRTS